MDKYCKYDRYRKYVSYDGGQTWQPLNEYKTGGLIEYNSQECGYVVDINDPTLPMYKWEYDGYDCAECANEMSKANKKAYGVRVDGVAYEIPCNGDGMLTAKEIEDYTNYYVDFSPIKTIIIGDCVTTFEYGLLKRYENTIEYIEYGKNLKGDNYVGVLNSKSLNTVIIRGNNVISSPNYRECKSLSSVTIDYGTDLIGEQEFGNSSAIKSIDIPGSVKIIGDDAFAGCSGIEKLTIGEGVKLILDRGFRSCSGFTSLNIPDTVEFLGYIAFSGCTSLESLRIGKSVKYIDENEFAGTSITSVTIPDSVEYVGEYAFTGCKSLKSVKLSNNLKIINRGMFHSCSSLESITIPNGVKTIYDRAFENCSSLTSVTIPDSVEYIGEYAFRGCTGLTVTLPYGVKYLGWDSVKVTTLPNSVEFIGDSPFDYSLTSVTFPDSVKVIEDLYNSNTYKATSVTIGTGIISIGEAFFYNTVIKSFTVLATTPPSIINTTRTFQQATNLTIYVPDASVDAYKKADVWSRYAGKIKPLSSRP